MKKDVFVYVAVCVILAIGSITPIHEINRTAINTVSSSYASQPAYLNGLSEEELMMGGLGSNFRGEVKGSFFNKYLAR